MLDTANIPTQNPDVLGRMANDEAVLVIPQKGQVKVLNEVGALVWDLMDGKRNIAQIVDGLCAQFDVDRCTAETDTIKFIVELLDRDMVVISTD